MTSKSFLLQAAKRYQRLAMKTAAVALTVEEGQQSTLLEVARHLDDMRISMERKVSKVEPAIAVLPANATEEEMTRARQRQSVQKGESVYLPRWSTTVQALPNAFLRSALFATSTDAQSATKETLPENSESLRGDREVATARDMTLTYTGHALCQFDRKVFSACVDYFRDIPLAACQASPPVKTNFYELCARMGQTYGIHSHRAILASLVRLSNTGVEIRHKGIDIKISHLLHVVIEDTHPKLKGRGSILLGVPYTLAELFGPGSWTGVNRNAVRFDGLLGWLASFYGSHSKALWLDVGWLYRMTGYRSHPRNFRSSLVRALDRLKSDEMSDACRVSAYHFSQDGSKLLVLKEGWAKPT